MIGRVPPSVTDDEVEKVVTAALLSVDDNMVRTILVNILGFPRPPDRTGSIKTNTIP
jgi:hypothetical protein